MKTSRTIYSLFSSSCVHNPLMPWLIEAADGPFFSVSASSVPGPNRTLFIEGRPVAFALVTIMTPYHGSGVSFSWSRYCDGISLNAVIDEAFLKPHGLTVPGILQDLLDEVDALEIAVHHNNLIGSISCERPCGL
ncbi:unnamed protein product [Cyprideis torosa]|uniref:O-acyltransferase WSD1 C-terminal domain-containing protein n=1 Tax=Cyprideis torosa TaxID=163714 RepID=A0A7R8ZT51_9CRUS|nr:unnamed protein product [Cyprideis torosa]CAG0907677.1 unnamed protein product [Cyprideis torosa]